MVQTADPPDGAGAARVHLGRGLRISRDTTMKSSLAWGSFLCTICLYWRHFGVGDGGYLDLAVGAGAGVRVGPKFV